MDIPRENLSPLPANSVFRASTNFSRIFSFWRTGGSRPRLRGWLWARPGVSSVFQVDIMTPPHFTDEEAEAQSGGCALFKVMQPQWQSQGLESRRSMTGLRARLCQRRGVGRVSGGSLRVEA